MADINLAPIEVSANPKPPEKGVTWSFFSEAGAAEPAGGKIGSQMRQSGFTDSEVADWQAKHVNEMRAAGFTQDEIDKDMGTQRPDMSGVQKFVGDNLKAQEAADLAEEKAAAERMKQFEVGHAIPTENGGAPAPAPEVPVGTVAKPQNWYDSLVDSASKGWGSSITGMLKRQTVPEALPGDANWAEKMAYSTTSLAGDVPFMIGGAFAGGVAASEVPVVGTAVGGAIGAFAVPAMIRKSLVDNLRGGRIASVGDFAQQTMAILYDGVKQGTVGALTAVTGGIAGAATKAAGPLVSSGAQTAAELATMVTAGKALEGQLPSLDDFTVGGAMVLALHGAVATPAAVRSVSKNLQDIYVKTGLKPKDVAEMAKNDPTIAQDIVIGNGVPTALKGHIDPTLVEESIPKLPKAPEVSMGVEPSVSSGNTSPTPWDNVSSHIDFKGQDAKTPWSWNSLYTQVVNDLHPIFVDQKAMLKALDKDLRDLPATKQPYILAQNSRGTFGRAEQQLEHGTYEFSSYKDNGAGLKEILAPIKDDMKGWATYAVAKRSLELAERGIESGIPLADAEAVVHGGAAKFEAINNEVIAFQNRVSKQLRDSGIISAEMYDKMLDMNKNYTPFFRVLDGENGGVGIGGGLNTSNPIHGIKGSGRDIINPLESIVKNTYVYTALAERNAIGKAYLQLAESTGHAEDWLTKVPPKLLPVKLNEGEIQKLFDEFLTVRKETKRTSTSTTETNSTNAAGETTVEPTNKIYVANKQRVMDALTARGFTENESETMMRRLSAGVKPGESAATSTISKTLAKEVETTTYVPELNIRLPNDMATVFRTLRTPLEDNQIAVFKEGKREVYELKNPETAEAFKGLDSSTSNLIVKALSVPAAAMRAGATSLSPDFLLRNPMRDQISSFVYGGNIPLVDLVSGIYSLVKKDAAFQDWLKGGGANAAMVSIDRTYLRDKLKAMDLQKLDGETGLMSRAWNVARTPLDILQIISETMENATRVGVFKRNMEGGSKADILQAANTSREASLDFAKKGSQVRAMNMITDFFSANVNGTDKMIRMARDNPAGFSVKVFVGVTLPSILLYEHNKDDDRYKSLPAWQKDLFHIVLTDDHVYRIPKDFGLGVVFGSGAEHMLKGFDDYNAGKSLDTASLGHYFATVWGSTLPPIIPTAVTPMLEQATNFSFFSGQKLVPDSKEKLLPEYQYHDYTTELTKKIGSMVGALPGMRSDLMPDAAKELASPIIIDNYVRQWTGGLGAYVVQLADYALRKLGIVNDPVKATATLADIPVVRAFVVRHPSSQAQDIQDFYDHESKNQKFYDTVQMLAKSGDVVGLQRELGLKPGEQVNTTLVNTAVASLARMPQLKQALGNMTSAVHAININPDIKPDEKRQLIDTIYNQMIQTSKAGNDAFRQIDDALGRSLLIPPQKKASETLTQTQDFVRN